MAARAGSAALVGELRDFLLYIGRIVRSHCRNMPCTLWTELATFAEYRSTTRYSSVVSLMLAPL